MSFILDALKKAEQQRRQGEVPRLHEEPPAPPPPPRHALWRWALVAILLLNAGLFGWWWYTHRPNSSPPLAARVPQRIAIPQTARPGPSIPPAAVSPAVPKPQLPVPAMPRSTAKATADPVRPKQAPARVEVSKAPSKKVAAASPPTPRPAATKPAPAAPARGVPSLAELPANIKAGLPDLDLQLHYYTERADRRLIRLNGVNLREGGKTTDGLTVVAIRRGGVVLSYRGTRFFLPVTPH